MTSRTPGPALPPTGAGRLPRRAALLLALPFVFYVVPLAFGFGWSALSPMTPVAAGLDVGTDRWPATPIVAEVYGAGVVVIPLLARVRSYALAGELPLWNPYQGLGQPFAAQGEGSPYFPLAILRALLPYGWSNAVTFVGFAISAICLYLLLRRLGLSLGASAFGGAVWPLSGALTTHIPRVNIADQLWMIPPLLLAAHVAISTGRAWAYVVLALVVAVHTVAGFPVIGVNALLLLSGFVLVLIGTGAASVGARARTLMTVGVFLVIGMALAAPYVLPILEAIQTSYQKNSPFLSLIPIPVANVVAFFFPLTFGQLFQSWLAGTYPDVVDWHNLYGYGGTGLALLAVVGLAASPAAATTQRRWFYFFGGALVFFLGRYVSFPPMAMVNLLPFLNQQSPKHAIGVAAFCLVVAAAFGVEWLRLAPPRRAAWLVGLFLLAAVSSLAVIVARRGGMVAVDVPAAGVYLGATGAIIAIVLAALRAARVARTDVDAASIATVGVVGELAVYLPLGTADVAVLAARVGLLAATVVAGVLVARGARLPAAVLGGFGLAAYAAIVVVPSAGLPRQVDLLSPPPYLARLRELTGEEYRAFGVQPDYSSVGRVQDVEAIGPLATPAFMAFVDVASSRAVADSVRSSSTFSLTHRASPTTWYDLTADYPRARPLFDWLGVRYLVLDHRFFGPGSRTDHLPLVDPASGLVMAYADEHVTILESPTAASKAVFATAVREVPDVEAALTRLRTDPASVAGPVMVEASADALDVEDGAGTTFAVPLASYRPNDLRAAFDAPGPGVLVVKDSFFPGWVATLNGHPAEVVRVNGLVRGVLVPTAGSHEVTMAYRPRAFVHGVALATVALAFLGMVLAWSGVRRPEPSGCRARVAAVVGTDG